MEIVRIWATATQTRYGSMVRSLSGNLFRTVWISYS